MADITIHVEGLAELDRKLLELSRNGARRALSKGMRQGGNVVLKEARQRINKRTGKTAKKIQLKNEGLKNGEVVFSVGANFVGRFLEFGTSKMPAYPFLRPATEAKFHEAIAKIADVTLAQIEIEAAKA